MIDLKMPIADLVRQVAAGELTPQQMAQTSLDAIKKHAGYSAILEVNPRALEDAEVVAQRLADGETLPLAGIPYIAKDNFLTFNTHTTAASNMLKPFTAPYQSTAVERLSAAGAIMVAKANLDAFAHGSSTENSDFGPTKNPVDDTRVPGGSSGGSAAAVALGLGCFALGTDTGGSIRQPAAFSGVVGYKPTYGLVSRYGVVPMGSSVDVIGPLANSVVDAALVLDVMAGPDSKDATTIARQPSYIVQNRPLKGLKVGVVQEYMAEGNDESVKTSIQRSIDLLEEAGAQVEKTSLPSVDLALACYYILIPAELSSNLARHDGIRYGHTAKSAESLADTYLKSRAEGFGDEAKRRIMIGTYVLSSGYYDAYYAQAQKVRTLMKLEFDRAFERYDILLGPTAPTAAFKAGEKTLNPLSMYLSDSDTVAVNLVDACAVSLPCGKDHGLPLGLQLIGKQRSDAELLGIAASVEALLASGVPV